jgi:hypothetical protein
LAIECCAGNRWTQTGKRLAADGITWEIHGHRDGDWPTSELAGTSAPLHAGIEEWRPLCGWSDDDVFAYLKSAGIELPRFYGYRSQLPERATCAANCTKAARPVYRSITPS